MVLAFYDGGARSFYNSKKPINSVADLAGMKFRVIQSDIFVDMVAALGANARRCPMAKSIRRSRPASSTAPRTTSRATTSAKHFEVAKNYSLDEHTIVPEVFVMSKVAWDKLTPEDQAIFKQAAKDSVAKQRELWAAKVGESRARSSRPPARRSPRPTSSPSSTR